MISSSKPLVSAPLSTRLPRNPPPPRSSSATSTHSSQSPVSSSLSASPSPQKKRKSLPAAAPPAPGPSEPPRPVKRLRTTSAAPAAKQKPKKKPKAASSKASSRATSRNETAPPSPEPLYCSSRSRSTSLFPPTLDPLPNPVRERRWITDENGDPGDHHLSSEAVVKRLMKKYKSYFKNPNDPNDKSFEPHPTNYPVVELEYPNSFAAERFILLAPKDKDHYNPIMDLERTLYTIVECYVPKEHQATFGPIPTDTLTEAVSPPPSPSPSPSPPRSSLTSLSSSVSSAADRLPLLRAVQRAIHLQDGPLFLMAMKRVNSALQALKYPALSITDPYAPAPRNALMQTVEGWTQTGLPEPVLMRIIEENYQRTVGPNVPSLKHYEAFSSTVYGELMPSLAQEMIRITELKEDSLFLDLGSGVGNVVVQASLQTGCTSYGIELMPHPARVARDVVDQMKVRCRMWGVVVGEMELEEGNMLESKRVDELIAKADVVLVDNKVFETSLNEALRPKFLDLKEGATVISLAPFVSSINARLTKRNVDDISAIFDVKERPYHSGSVSWGNNGGTYYLHKVDREGYSRIKEKFETMHGSSVRPARSSRSRR
ncbi:Histone-lysine N-methyltransferase, H3 lysine-79 specific [Psilocybe cubensis]|uniref:Histone-lysine N-methyltransferase, H3 lysine-79 specific n=2 Tax=Psilocybe cubensis TaxID=181762 RepID=A0A8H7YB14_PSICU|nr:Histone-lysine N-methyltransferase, H3 lysine-79 specific [Psilocybe cubensis]KAH9487179.1 Histone-lysine N-methyltransferase, H3 lysine-79 specific [Psilocybe cubensis]